MVAGTRRRGYGANNGAPTLRFQPGKRLRRFHCRLHPLVEQPFRNRKNRGLEKIPRITKSRNRNETIRENREAPDASELLPAAPFPMARHTAGNLRLPATVRRTAVPVRWR